jgi:hypothetical protein
MSAKLFSRRGFLKGSLATAAASTVAKVAAPAKMSAEQIIRWELNPANTVGWPEGTYWGQKWLAAHPEYFNRVPEFMANILKYAGSYEAWLADTGRRFVACQYDCFLDTIADTEATLSLFKILE